MTGPGKAGYWSSVLGGRSGAQNTELLITLFPDESIFLGGRMCVSGWKGRVEIWSWNCTCQLLPWINCIWLAQQVFIALREYKQNFARLSNPSSSWDTSYPELQQKSGCVLLFFFFEALMILHLIDAWCHCIHPWLLTSLCLQHAWCWLVNSFCPRCGCMSCQICQWQKVH